MRTEKKDIAARGPGAARKSRKRPAEPEGARILNRVERAIRKYVFLPQEEQYVTVTLWIAATYGIDQWDTATRLPIISPERRCGKSRLLEIISHLCWKPLKTSNATVAAITRSLTKQGPPTLLMDEADAIFGTKKSAENHEELRGVINAGHQRGNPVLRWDVTKRRLEELNTYAMVAMCSIKDLPDTIMDRGPAIRMRRKSKNDAVLPFRRQRDGRALEPLGERLHEWMNAQTFDEVDDLPVEDRAADNWEPLIAVADAAGGDWPERARSAAKLLTDAEETLCAESFGLELLRHIRDIFQSRPTMRAVHSQDLVAALVDMEDGPWGSYGGTGLDPAQMARLLKPYGIHTDQVKIAGRNAKGYRLDGWTVKGSAPDAPKEGGLRAAFNAYLPDEEGRYVDDGGGDDA